jgi:hypothetical protein
MTAPISDEALERLLFKAKDEAGYIKDGYGFDVGDVARDMFAAGYRAALQEPVSIPEYVKHVRMWRSGDGWDVFIKRIDDTYTAFSTTDPIAAIRNAVEADTP